MISLLVGQDMFLGLSEIQISFISSIAQILISVVALFIAIVNLKILRRLNIVDSMRWVNDKFTGMNNILLLDDENIKLDPLIKKKNKSSEIKISKIKSDIMIFNHLNILELVYLEMKYKTLKKDHAHKIMKSFIPEIVNNKKLRELLQSTGYDDDFIKYCMTFKKK